MSEKLRLICGDANMVLDRLIQEKVKVDMIFTSPNPPFYTKDNPDLGETITIGNLGNESSFHIYIENLMITIEKLRAILTDEGSLWLHSGDYSRSKGSLLQIPARIAGIMTDKYKWILKSELIWVRKNEGGTPDLTRFRHDHERLFWFAKKDGIIPHDSSYLDSSIIDARYILPAKDVWESGFPERLCEIPIKTCTTEGQTVLDPFMGSGTTGKVALQLKRKFIGTELFPYKFALTSKRLREILRHV